MNLAETYPISLRHKSTKSLDETVNTGKLVVKAAELRWPHSCLRLNFSERYLSPILRLVCTFWSGGHLYP